MKPILLPMEASTRHLFLLQNLSPKKSLITISRHFQNPKTPIRRSSVRHVSNLGLPADPDSKSTAVLLGWLGAEEKHLKRYAELYRARGIRPVRFVVPVKETIGFDLCRGLEDRVAELSREIATWCGESKDRSLVFHTFSNTGWLVYGVLLQNFQSRTDIIKRIKGCVFDSAPSADVSSPQVWAAGYCAALLKTRKSTLAETAECGTVDRRCSRLNVQDIMQALIVMVAMNFFKFVFSVILLLPYANQRLTSVVSTLKQQPPCPQLYLYSSADKVIPAHAVECFMGEQKALGKHIYSHDFGLSPHVDHFRTFPDIYSSKVDDFLEHCCVPTVHKI